MKNNSDKREEIIKYVKENNLYGLNYEKIFNYCLYYFKLTFRNSKKERFGLIRKIRNKKANKDNTVEEKLNRKEKRKINKKYRNKNRRQFREEIIKNILRGYFKRIIFELD